MSEKTARGRLRLHRETLRTLSDTRLARVAGGDFVIAVQRIDFTTKDMNEPAPRSNGWTTSDGTAVPTC